MAGLIGAAALAMATNRVLLVDWDGLDDVLSPNLVDWRYDEKRVVSEETASWLAGASSGTIGQQRASRGKHDPPHDVGAMVSWIGRPSHTHAPTHPHTPRTDAPTHPHTRRAHVVHRLANNHAWRRGAAGRDELQEDTRAQGPCGPGVIPRGLPAQQPGVVEGAGYELWMARVRRVVDERLPMHL